MDRAMKLKFLSNAVLKAIQIQAVMEGPKAWNKADSIPLNIRIPKGVIDLAKLQLGTEDVTEFLSHFINMLTFDGLMLLNDHLSTDESKKEAGEIVDLIERLREAGEI